MDPTSWFSTSAYLARYPEVARSGENPFYHYLTRGRAEGFIAAPTARAAENLALLGLDPARGLEIFEQMERDLADRLATGELGAQVRKATEIEPMIGDSWLVRNVLPPITGERLAARAHAILRLQAEAGHRPARFVIVLNAPRWGKAGLRVNDLLADYLVETYGADSTLLLYTQPVGDAALADHGCRSIRLGDATQGMTEGDRIRIFAYFLRQLRPEFVCPINCELFYLLMRDYGNVLSREMKLVPYFLNTARTYFGFARDFPNTEFYPHFHEYHRVLTDSQYLKDWFTAEFGLPEPWQDRIMVMESPCLPELAALQERTMSAVGAGPAQVFWAGRSEDQKRIDIAFRVAERMPEVEFHLYTDFLARESNRKAAFQIFDPPANAVFHPPFDSFDEVPLESFGAMLYTSEWDGTPRILIEMAVAGLPIVASRIAGVPEIALAEYCELIDDLEDIDAYVAALRRVLGAPQEARARAQALAAETLRRRSPEAWARTVERLLAT